MPSPLPRHTAAWSTGAFFTRIIQVEDTPTVFDSLVRRLGLQDTPHLWRYDNRLRAFAKRNRNRLYIPEEFLHELGLTAELEE